MSETVKNIFSNLTGPFSSSSEVATTDPGFLNSNGLIAKIVFLILVIVIFIVVFYSILYLMAYFTTPSENPYIIKGEIDGSSPYTVPQNPALNESKVIQRSNNESSGLEFTWSVWLKISSTATSDIGKRYPIFIKGDGMPQTPLSGTPAYKSINHGPGVYVFMDASNAAAIEVLMDTIDKGAIGSGGEIIKIKNLPINQYFHLAVRCKGYNIHIYINGNIIINESMSNVPKQNYYDILVCPSGGFKGKLSNLRYFSKALSVVELNSIYRNGPNTTPVNNVSSNSYSSISTQWFASFA
jgi:hypothetical protein|uniref:Uncharacterized protein n=1 Tax=viral metagenome TaxID=1070528 RepID=A0A6C0DY75_9ZZZZ